LFFAGIDSDGQTQKEGAFSDANFHACEKAPTVHVIFQYDSDEEIAASALE
jgi:hypothetical protein